MVYTHSLYRVLLTGAKFGHATVVFRKIGEVSERVARGSWGARGAEGAGCMIGAGVCGEAAVIAAYLIETRLRFNAGDAG